MAQESRSCLPMEIIEEIVGHHREWEDYGRASATLLACLATSRQFRQSALRHLCADAHVYLDRPNQLKRLHDCITSAGVIPYMKSITVVVSSQQKGDPLRLDENVVLPLLHTILHKLTLRKLTLRGHKWLWENMVTGLPWPEVPRKTRVVLQSLAQVPSVTCLFIRSFQDVPLELFSQRSYEKFAFANGTTSTSISVAKLNTPYLTLEYAQFINTSLPNLRHLTACCNLPNHYESIWGVVKDCCNTLETIKIYGTNNFLTQQCSHLMYLLKEYPSSTAYVPPDIKLHMFPMLEELTYSVSAWTPNSEITPMFFKLFPTPQTSNVASNLKTLNMKFKLTDCEDLSADKFWATKLAGSPVGHSWIDLDKILSKKVHFPVLRKVSIYFTFTKRGDSILDLKTNDPLVRSSVDTTVLREGAQYVLGKMFSASIEASVPLEIVVDNDILI